MPDEELTTPTSDAEHRRIGVYICHCGGNISDFVDVAAVRDAVATDPNVVHAETTLFACSDATQHDMVERIQRDGLDGLVVASCSPKLHVPTFRAVSRRAGLNQFQYTQVNIREQCSWVHSDDRPGATAKAAGLVRAGIGHASLSVPLEPVTVDTVPSALVVGGGVAGLRAAVGLADLGLGVTLIERTDHLGGAVGGLGAMFPSNQSGRELIAQLVAEVADRPSIRVLLETELVAKSGSFGNYEVRLEGPPGTEPVTATVGVLVIATGFASYEPALGEFGYGIAGVVTLPEFTAMVDASPGPLQYRGRPVGSIAYVYCVGSRQPGGNEYCSKYCCTATAHVAVQVAARDDRVTQYHLYRDVRTYGVYELLYEEARKRGSVYLKYADDAPPDVARRGDQLVVTARDTLTGPDELEIPVDLVVLVTGMVAAPNHDLTSLLKLPLGSDGFYNEIHPKLRPVETVVDGVLIAGASQGPKTVSESVASALAAVAQSGAMLLKGQAELNPLVAVVGTSCAWCGECASVCPYDAISRVEVDGVAVAHIDPSACKGCGGCAPYCPNEAIDLLGVTTAQVELMIEGMVAPVHEEVLVS